MTDETKKGPTTAELLETLRSDIELTGKVYGFSVDRGDGRIMATISELERRMGAMERAARPLLKLVRGECGPVGRAMADALDAAFTDAPPVFTLEEVEAAVNHAFNRWNSSTVFMQDVRDYLAALRSTGGGR